MKKFVITLSRSLIILGVSAFILAGCDHLCQQSQSKHTRKRRSVEPYWPVKICSLGDQTGESCVEYKAKKILMNQTFLSFYDLDDYEYQYNNAGWSIVISPKVE